MFKTMNKNELMSVSGGFYYVPNYRNGVFVGLTQIESSDPYVKKVEDGVRLYYRR